MLLRQFRRTNMHGRIICLEITLRVYHLGIIAIQRIHVGWRRQSERTEINIEFLTDLVGIFLVCSCLGPGIGFKVKAGDRAEY